MQCKTRELMHEIDRIRKLRAPWLFACTLLLPGAPNNPDIGAFYVIAPALAHLTEEYLDAKKGGAISGPARKYNLFYALF